MTTVYYRDRSVEVTTHAIQVDNAVFRFDDLTRVWHQRGRRSWKRVAGRGAWGLTYLIPFLLAAAALVAAFALDVSGGVRVTLIATAILILLGLSAGPLIDPVLGKLDDSFDRGIYPYEIWVEHNGVEIRLLQTPDASRFGRIYRAVQRAAES